MDDGTWFFWGILLVAVIPYASLPLAYRRVLTYKHRQIKALFGAEAQARYNKAQGPLSHEDLFEILYETRAYILPVALVLLTATVVVSGLVAAVLPTIAPEAIRLAVGTIPSAAVAGGAGAYVWGLYELLDRFQREDLTPMAINRLWVRFFVAIALGGIVGGSFVAPVNLLVGFGIGAFPLRTVRDWLQSAVSARLHLKQREDHREPDLQSLQGCSDEIILRLQDDGIYEASHLAMTDPLLLYLKTNLPWKTILDLIDQALLYGYVTSHLPDLRQLGIRGALEMSELAERVDSNEAARGEDLTAMVGGLAGTLGIPEEAVRNLFWTLRQDAQVLLIGYLWEDAFVEAQRAAASR